MNDLLDRLQAADIAPDETPPAWEDTRRRLAPRPPLWRRPRALALGAAVAAAAVAVTFVADSGDAPHRPPLGVIEAAAATAATDARFSGYTAETRMDIRTPDGPGTQDRSWTIVRPVSDTEYEARIEYLRPPAVGDVSGGGAPESDGVERLERREGEQIRDIMRWRQPYGTMFQLIPAFFGRGSTEGPVLVPTDPDAVAAAVAAWAADRVPAGAHPEQVFRIEDAGRSPIQRALLYAGNVLTAPRVSSAVRAAVFRALSRVDGVRVNPQAKDRLGRPAAALMAEDTDGRSRTRSELLIDTGTSRILAERHVFSPEPGVNENRGQDDPPVGEGWQETTYRYTH
jgi:hypothetical protein